MTVSYGKFYAEISEKDCDTFRTWYDAVQIFRKETQEKFPWPTNEWCVLYAITELGEAVDKLARSLRPNDVRANDRDAEGIVDELADIAMMILSYRQGWDNQPHNSRYVAQMERPVYARNIPVVFEEEFGDVSLRLGKMLTVGVYQVLPAIVECTNTLMKIAKAMPESISTEQFYLVLASRLHKRCMKVANEEFAQDFLLKLPITVYIEEN
jgi:NTP pyrophosphatase (non-canonical NTP hydrolase)